MIQRLPGGGGPGEKRAEQDGGKGMNVKGGG